MDTVTLKEHFDALLAEKEKAIRIAMEYTQNIQTQRDKAIESALSSAKEAVGLAELTVSDKSLVAKNEIAALQKKVDDLLVWQSLQKGKASRTELFIFGAITVILFLMKIWEFFGK